MKLLLNAFAALIVSLPSLANASSYQGIVVDVYAAGGSVFIILDSGAFGSSSGCPSGTRGLYSIDPSSTYGRAMLAISLSAKVTGRLVWAAGDGACAANPAGITSETLVQIDLKG